MQTQINCPNCGTPFSAQVYNIVDAQRTPELKEMLLAGALNVATCPNCGTSTQLAIPMAYHDAENSLFMVYVPMELNLPMTEQEKLIGQMTKAITDGIPQEEFRAYLLQPQNILTMQTFMEKVYETEGITPDMLKRQRDQAQLLQRMITASKEEQTALIEENLDMIDETFFAMLSSNLQAAEQSPQANQTFIKLTNLQARLFTVTEIGQKLETMQMALRQFQQEAQKAGGLTLDLFLKYLIKHAEDTEILNALIEMGQQGIRYELFSRLSEKIDDAESLAEKEKLLRLRSKLLAIYEEMQEQAKTLMAEAENTLDLLMGVDDLDKAIEKHADKINDNFLYYLTAQIQQAEQIDDKPRLDSLKKIHEAIMEEAEKQMPPELRLLNVLLSTEDESLQRQLIAELPPEGRTQFKALLQMMGGELANSNPALGDRIEKIQTML